MRILIATWNRNLVGGVEKYLKVVLPGLLARGHQVGLVYERPVDLERETIDPPQAPLAKWGLAELGFESVVRAVEEWKPHVVYSQGLETDELEDVLLRTYPTVLFAHNYYGTCGTGYKYHRFPQVLPCGRRFGPMCLLLHYPRRCGGLDPWKAWRVYQRQAQRNARLADYRAVVVASAHMYREFLKHGLAPEKIHCVPLPAADSASQATPPAPRAPRGRILLIGRLTNLKGGHYLIQALPRAAGKLGPLTLTIAGDGPERQNLQDLAHRFHLGGEFVGWVPTHDAEKLMRDADLLAVPSLWPEPFGQVGIEGGRLGVPAVGYAVGGIPDWLIPGRSGELAPGDPPTVQGLAEAIVRVLADPSHYSSLCRGAWELASRFTLDAHLAELEPILGAEESTSAV
jgi:glycosyltransferase involved in cell wall biosynthesis